MHTVYAPVAAVHEPRRAIGEVEVEAVLRRDLVAARYHHWIGRRGVAATCGGGRISAEAHALCLGLQRVRRPVACRPPAAECARLIRDRVRARLRVWVRVRIRVRVRVRVRVRGV